MSRQSISAQCTPDSKAHLPLGRPLVVSSADVFHEGPARDFAMPESHPPLDGPAPPSESSAGSLSSSSSSLSSVMRFGKTCTLTCRTTRPHRPLRLHPGPNAHQMGPPLVLQAPP